MEGDTSSVTFVGRRELFWSWRSKSKSQGEIDRSIEEDLAVAEAFRRNNSSPLREKLKALRGG